MLWSATVQDKRIYWECLIASFTSFPDVLTYPQDSISRMQGIGTQLHAMPPELYQNAFSRNYQYRREQAGSRRTIFPMANSTKLRTEQKPFNIRKGCFSYTRRAINFCHLASRWTTKKDTLVKSARKSSLKSSIQLFKARRDRPEARRCQSLQSLGCGDRWQPILKKSVSWSPKLSA